MRLRGPRHARRGMLLVAVLIIIALLALIGTSFSFRMNAELAAVTAVNYEQQAREAAHAGVWRAVKILRDERTDVDAWYHNREAFRRILVWAPGEEGGSFSLADQEKVEGRPAWRFSIVNYELDGDDADIRYGLTDEASKINLNYASRAQLLTLFDQLDLKATEGLSPQALADALIDWRDEDDTPVSDNGAETDYYKTLNPPYSAKNGLLQTIEELLMVKGFDGQILYGEDYNRNGWMDQNEDDGPEGAFPPDDGDGVLERGLLPLITVYSWDWNWGNDNKFRFPINSISQGVIEQLPRHVYEEVPLEVLEFIAEARQRGYELRSAGELLGLEVFEDGTSNYTEAWQEYHELLAAAEKDRLGTEATEEARDEAPEEPEEVLDPEADELMSEEEEQEAEEAGELDDRNPKDPRADEEDEESKQGPSARQEMRDGENEGGRRDRRRTPRSSRRAPTGTANQPVEADASGREEPEPKAKGTPIICPAAAEDMAVILDRLTAVDPGTPLVGLINVNTASPSVLKTLPGLTEEQVSAIVSTRGQLEGEDKQTIAWLVTSGVLDAETFALVSNRLTTRSLQFTIDVVGFADHVGAFKRLQVVVEMRGHLSQIRYYRDITPLGIGYPVWDDERSEGFAALD